MKTKLRVLFLVTVFLFSSACATAQTTAVPAGSANAAVKQLETDLADARSRSIDVLSPRFYKDAETSFAKAKQSLDKGAKISTINKYVAEGNASLKKAEEFTRISQTILGDTIVAREKALAVGADQLGKPFTEAEKEYLNLTKAIENDNPSYAQQYAPKVKAAFQELEIMAIKNNALKDTRAIMAAAEKNKISKIAPKAYDDARSALDEADRYVQDNPYDGPGIAQKAAMAQLMARRMEVVAANSTQFKGMTPEATALYLEGVMVQLSDAIETGEIRDQEVDAQVNIMTGAVETLKRKNQSLDTENQNLQAQLSDLEQRLVGVQGYSREQEAAKRKLAAEREFNKQFDTVQRFFDPDEAEVYKQGNQLVIRLRGIKFPVGQATLSPENYTLLSKVQQAIQTFGQPMVTIEGHTDSTGSAKTNQELSQKRAEAVKTYLVANKTLPKDRIRAAGYGPSRPLAPNTTAAGRAANRRIDVVITPEKVQ